MDDLVLYNFDNTMIISSLDIPCEEDSATPNELYYNLWFKRNKVQDYLAKNIKVKILSATGLLTGDSDDNGQALLDAGEIEFRSNGIIGDGIIDDAMEWIPLTTDGVALGDMPQNTARSLAFRILDPGGYYGRIRIQIVIEYEAQRTECITTEFFFPEAEAAYYDQKYYQEGYYN
jgi:hypothetical protein